MPYIDRRRLERRHGINYQTNNLHHICESNECKSSQRSNSRGNSHYLPL